MKIGIYEEKNFRGSIADKYLRILVPLPCYSQSMECMHNNESHKVRGLSETEGGWPRSVEFPDALTVNSTWIN